MDHQIYGQLKKLILNDLHSDDEAMLHSSHHIELRVAQTFVPTASYDFIAYRAVVLDFLIPLTCL